MEARLDFVGSPEPPPPGEPLLVRFVFREGQNLLVDPARPDRLLAAPEFADLPMVPLGRLCGRPCVAVEAPAAAAAPEGLAFVGLRSLHGGMDEGLRNLAGGGFQLLHWRRTHRFCGACGTPTVAKADERALSCPACGHLAFPRIDAAIIVGVRRGERLLLAHNRRFRNNMHSLIAGFVEVGETLEEAVATYEVRERLESMAAGLAARRVDAAARAALDEQLAAMNAVDPADQAEHVRADDAFHGLVARLSGNPVLQELVERLSERVMRVKVLTRDVNVSAFAREQHARIVAAIGAGDEAAAEAAMREHIRTNLRIVEERLAGAGPGAGGEEA